MVEAGISFLGITDQPSRPSWGKIISEGYSLITSDMGNIGQIWHIIILPCICITLLTLAGLVPLAVVEIIIGTEVVELNDPGLVERAEAVLDES